MLLSQIKNNIIILIAPMTQQMISFQIQFFLENFKFILKKD